MALVTSDWASGKIPMPQPVGAEVVSVLISLPVTAAQTADGDLYYMCDLPENCKLVDAIYAATDIDTGSPAHAMSFGQVPDTGTGALTTALEASITVGQGGTAARMTPTRTTMAFATTGAAKKRLGYEVTTSSATGAAGTVYLELFYRSTIHGA